MKIISYESFFVAIFIFIHLLYFTYIEQQLYVGILKHMSNGIAERIFHGTNISLGAQIEFHYQWSQWIKNFNQESGSNEKNQSNDNTNQILTDINETIEESSTSKSNQSISLHTILKSKSNPYGTSVCDYYRKNGVLDDKIRKLLCEAVLFYCIETKHNLSKKDCASLTEQIVQSFKGEVPVNLRFKANLCSISNLIIRFQKISCKI